MHSAQERKINKKDTRLTGQAKNRFRSYRTLRIDKLQKMQGTPHTPHDASQTTCTMGTEDRHNR